MKKLLFAVLLLTPAFAAAEPASLANRINVTLNVSHEDTRGFLNNYIKMVNEDQDVAAGLSVGYNFMDMLELGLNVNVIASIEYTHPIDHKTHDATGYATGAYAKVLAPQLALSSDTGLSFYGKVGLGQYFYDDTVKDGHTTTTTSYDWTGMSYGFGADINFPNWIIGLEYQLHRVRYETIAQNIGLNVGYRF